MLAVQFCTPPRGGGEPQQLAKSARSDSPHVAAALTEASYRPGGRAYAGQRSMTGVPIILCLWFDNMCHVRRPAIQQRRRPDAYTQAGWEAAGSFRRIAANFGPSPFHDASHKYAVSREPEQGTVKLGRSDGAERVGEVACGGSTPTRRYSPPASDNVRSERMWGSRVHAQNLNRTSN